MSQIVALTGASGMLGRPTVARLLARRARLRILSSKEGSAQALRAAGAQEVIVGDIRKESDLDRLVAGADTVIHIPPSLVEDEDRIGLSMIGAAKRAGTPHFIFLSCFHPIIAELRHHANKLRVEQGLIKSGLSYTVLQPATYMQNLGFIWPKVQATGVFAWPWGPEGRYAMVDIADIAEAIAIVATDQRFRGGTFELCSADVSGNEMAAMLGEAMGRTLTPGKDDAAAWAASLKETGWPAWSAETVLGMSRFHNDFAFHGGNAFVLESILGRKATSYADFARRWVAEKAA